MADDCLYDLYLKYTPQDEFRIHRLAKQLRKAGFKVWFDKWGRKSNGDTRATSLEIIQTCPTVLFCISAFTVRTDAKALTKFFESRLSKSSGQRVIPVVLDRTSLPAVVEEFQPLDYPLPDSFRFTHLLSHVKALFKRTKSFDALVALLGSRTSSSQPPALGQRALLQEHSSAPPADAAAFPRPFHYDVFLRYHSSDRDVVRSIAQLLQRKGLKVWFDEWAIQPGDNIADRIEEGLQACHTLLLFLSPAAVQSEWISLERSTISFRDSRSHGRHFIPILLKPCTVPDALSRYSLVHYSDPASNFEPTLASRLLSPALTKAYFRKRTIRNLVTACKANIHIPPSCTISAAEVRLSGHTNWVRSLAISPDGQWAASGSDDCTVRVWDLASGESRSVLQRHDQYVASVAIADSGRLILSASTDGTVRLWDAQTSELIKEYTSDLCISQAYFQGERSAIIISQQHALFTASLLSFATADIKLLFTSPPGASAIVPTNQGSGALVGYTDGTLKHFDFVSGAVIGTFVGHREEITSIHISLDGTLAASTSCDRTIRVWNLRTETCVGQMEGFSNNIQDAREPFNKGDRAIAVSADGSLIAAVGMTNEQILVWETATGIVRSEFREALRTRFTSLRFTPDGTRLVAATGYDTGVYVFQIRDRAASVPEHMTERYVNAKIVLVGESGVGKSGLAHRLIEDKFVLTYSTHGMHVRRFDLPLSKENGVEREALLWDLAGQDDYKIVHQLYLEETALALVLFNPQKDDPFAEVVDWLKALDTAARFFAKKRLIRKLLVAARIDVGHLKISQAKIDRFLATYDFAGYLGTSAKRGDNCSDRQGLHGISELKALITKHIPWSELPWTSTFYLLRQIQHAILIMADRDQVAILRFSELIQRLKQTLSLPTVDTYVIRTSLTLLANQGLVIVFKFGDLVLLRPELLSIYASALITSARTHIDEIGCVMERDVFQGNIGLTDAHRLPAPDEQLLLRAVVQTLLDKCLCMAEETLEGRQLIFPSQFRRDREIPQVPIIVESYKFQGELQTVYTTLVVRLWYSSEFSRKELWRNAAEFTTKDSHSIGIVLERSGEGEGRIGIFADSNVSDSLRGEFSEFVRLHLRRYAHQVERERQYRCGSCGTPVLDALTIRNRKADGKQSITCQRCDSQVSIADPPEISLVSPSLKEKVLRMDQIAEAKRDTQSLEQMLLGHMMAICAEANQIFRPTSMFDYGIDGEVEFKDWDGSPSGKKVYVQLKNGSSYLRDRKRDKKSIFDVKVRRHLEYWVRQPVDVYLVIRTPNEDIRWMNVTEYLRAHGTPFPRAIEFDGVRLDVSSLWKIRDKLIGASARGL